LRTKRPWFHIQNFIKSKTEKKNFSEGKRGGESAAVQEAHRGREHKGAKEEKKRGTHLLTTKWDNIRLKGKLKSETGG